MNSMVIIGCVEIVLGVIINIFIKKIVMFLFKKGGFLSYLPVRVAGVWLLINGISRMFNV